MDNLSLFGQLRMDVMKEIDDLRMNLRECSLQTRQTITEQTDDVYHLKSKSYRLGQSNGFADLSVSNLDSSIGFKKKLMKEISRKQSNV